MLNELYSLSEALDNAGIAPPDWHINYLELRGGEAIRIFLDDQGGVKDFDRISAELTAKLRKYGNNQATFPAFNMEPLFRLSDPAAAKEYKDLTKNPGNMDFDKIKDWRATDNWGNSPAKRLARCIIVKSAELRQCIEQVAPDEANSLTALIQAVGRKSDDYIAKLRADLEACAFSKLQRGEDIPAALAVLFHDKILSVILDCADWRKYEYPVASERVTKWTNGVLLKAADSRSQPAAAQGSPDAFGLPLHGDEIPTMPKVKLDGTEVILRSMFKQVPCQGRYNLFESDSFPLSEKNRSLVKKSMEYLSRPENNGKTWTRIDSEEILFAYPSTLPELAPVPGIATTMVGDGKAYFINCSEDFISIITKLYSKLDLETILIFSLRKIDKARTKVIFTRSVTVEHYIDGMRRWRHGCVNVPGINSLKTLIPFPMDIAGLCNTIWKQNGETATVDETPKGSILRYQGIDLLLDTGDKKKFLRFLRPLTQNWRGIVSFMGNQWHRKNMRKPPGNRFDKLRKFVPLLGLLLYKGGYEKEEYMDSPAYNLGQLLKVSDELHAMYCLVKRKGDVPPQLAGNSVFAIASETPVKAIAILGQRMSPYLAWAKQYVRQNDAAGKPGQESAGNEMPDGGAESKDAAPEPGWRAGWYLKLFAHFSDKLGGLQPAARFDEFDQAQVFLGYLANFPKLAKADNAGEADNKEDFNEEEQSND